MMHNGIVLALKKKILTFLFQWDFEEANAKWSETPAKQKRVDEFPLQEWLKIPQHLSKCTCGMSVLVEETASGKEVDASGTTASMPR